MAESHFPRRHLFLVASIILACLALGRLGVLMHRQQGTKMVQARPALVEKEIRGRVLGAAGDTIRVHLPEVPLNLDCPYADGSFRTTLALSLPRPPQRASCQVLKDGVVIAESQDRALSAGREVDLGTVQVKALEAR